MIDGGPSSEVPEDSSQHEELPDRLRVHSLARALGTTSRQVLDALTELDGRIRSAHSTVERVDAVRVRDLLASAPGSVTTVVATEASAAGDADEPESRTMLETTTVERPEYMPLFVAPQPVERRPDVAVAEEPADSDDDDDFDSDSDSDADGDDDEQADRPANRRRRRGRRGRGRGRGDQNGADGGENGAKSDAASGDDADDDDSDDDADDSDADDNGSGEGATKRRRRRRRRKSGSGDDSDDSSSPDDPPNTVVHERAPRAKNKPDSSNSEIQGIDGSTRLEAKRQRRRDGRDAGRRRPPVLSEAEFLARRTCCPRWRRLSSTSAAAETACFTPAR